MERVDDPTEVLVTVCSHGRPMAVRLYDPTDPAAHEWRAEELRSMPEGWDVQVWPRGADLTWCSMCDVPGMYP